MRVRAVAVAIALALLSAAALATTAHSQPAPAHKRLTDSLALELGDRLRSSGRISSVDRTEPGTLRVKSLGGAEVTIHLGNLASEVAVKPAQRAELVARFVSSVLAAIASDTAAPKPVTREAFIASLRLVVRPQAYVRQVIAQLAAGPAGPQNQLLARPFAGDAMILVAVDGGENVTMALAGSGAAHGLSDDDLFVHAREQLGRYATAHEKQAAGPVRAFIAEDEHYSPSLLFVDVIWAKVEQEFGRGFLVAVPDRATLLAAPLRNAADLKRAADGIVRQRKSQSLIDHFLQRDGGAWKAYTSQ